MPKAGMRLIIFLSVFFCSSRLSAQQQMGSFMAYGPEVKYFSNLNYRVYESKNGYLWFGTLNGLVRFDGKRYKNYFSNPSDPNSPADNVIFDITEDKSGNLWFAGFYHGLTKYNQRTGRFTKYPVLSKDNNPYYGINSVYNDSQGALWAGTSGRGLALYDPAKDSFQLYFPEPDKCRDGTIRGFNHVTDIQDDQSDKNILWLTTFHGLYTFDKTTKQFTHYPSGLAEAGQPDILFTNMEQDHNGFIWLGTWGLGLRCYSKATKKIDPVKANTSVSVVYDLTATSDSTIYAACLNGGLYSLNTRTGAFTNITPPRNPADRTADEPGIQKVSFTPHAGVFVGGNYYVYQQHPAFVRLAKKINFPDLKKGDDIGLTNCVWDAYRQCYWMGASSGAGLYRMEKDMQHISAVGYDAEPGQLSTFFRNLCTDGLNRVWALHYFSGLYLYDEKKNRFVKPGNLFPETKVFPDNVRRITSNPEGNIWMLADSNFVYWDVRSGSVSTFPIKWNKDYNGTNSLFNSQLVTDPDGDAWLFTENGIFHCKRKENSVVHIFKTGLTNDDLFSSIVRAGAFNKHNDLWLSSGNGIQVLNRENYKVLANHNLDGGLPSMSVNSIATDSSGRIWAGTASGLGMFDPAKKNWLLFSRIDGLEKDYLDGYLGFTSNNKIVIDQGNGFLLKDPSEMMFAQQEPILHLTSVNVNGQPFSDSLLPEFITSLNLPYDKNNIDIEFAAMDWLYPFKTIYRYRIEGLPALQTWVIPNQDCRINLIALPPGNYVLHLQALNGSGGWSKEIVFPIKINPPFWKTWWFVVVCTLLLFALLYALYRYRIGQLLHMQRVRNSISRDLHDEIGATLSSVNMLSAVALIKAGESNEAAPIIEKIKESVQRAGESIDDIVWSVNPSNDAALDTFARIRKQVTELAESKKVNCVIEMDEPEQSVKLPMETRRDIYLVCKEAVNNALKYSGCTELHLAIRLKSQDLFISIEDNGKGFDTGILKHTGRNGIANMRHRIEKHKGSFELVSEPGKGTRIFCKIKW